MRPGLGRRLRRRLGLPVLSARAWLLVVLAILGLVYAGTAVIADFAVKLARYAPRYYEPKDFQRQDLIERQS